MTTRTLHESEGPARGRRVLPGRKARFAAALFHYGDLLALLVPFPLMIFWLGASMFVYAMNRHHPNPKVGHYTQRAAYVFYGVTGFFVAVGMFLPARLDYYLAAWGLMALILVPWTLRELWRIHHDTWEDQVLGEEAD